MTGSHRPARLLQLGTALVLTVACTTGRSNETKQLMTATIAPASDAVFNAVVYVNGAMASAPNSAEQWATLAQRAQTLAEAGRTLRRVAPASSPDTWTRASDAMTDAAIRVVSAAERKDEGAVLDGGSRLYATCTACHEAYLEVAK